MKDEKLAEEYYYKTYPVTLNIGEEARKEKVMNIFLAGLKAERPQWNKVADGDLPEAENHFWSRTVLLQTNKGSSIIGFYDHTNKTWYEKATDDIVYGVVAWCEIPVFTDKENK